MHEDDEIDALFDAAGQQSDAIAALDGAVDLLKQARDAKAKLSLLGAPALRASLLRRSATLGGEPR